MYANTPPPPTSTSLNEDYTKKKTNKVKLNLHSQLPIIPTIRYHPQASLLQGIR